VPTWSGIGNKSRPLKRLCYIAAEKALKAAERLQSKMNLKSRIPLLQQTKRRKQENRLPKQSNQNSLIPSQSRKKNEKKGLSKE
jgi:hypothetical protein